MVRLAHASDTTSHKQFQLCWLSKEKLAARKPSTTRQGESCLNNQTRRTDDHLLLLNSTSLPPTAPYPLPLPHASKSLSLSVPLPASHLPASTAPPLSPSSAATSETAAEQEGPTGQEREGRRSITAALGIRNLHRWAPRSPARRRWERERAVAMVSQKFGGQDERSPPPGTAVADSPPPPGGSPARRPVVRPCGAGRSGGFDGSLLVSLRLQTAESRALRPSLLISPERPSPPAGSGALRDDAASPVLRYPGVPTVLGNGGSGTVSRGLFKRKRSEEHGGGAVNRPAQKRKQHLYLLLDDWERGYSVRKLDVNAFDSAADTNLPPKGFTDQPLARIEAPHVRSWNFVSHDSKIFAMKAKEASPAIPAFDTNTLSLTICPWPSCHADYVIPLFASISDKLFLFLEDRTEYLGNPPPHDSNAPWSWTTINSPLPFYNMQIMVALSLYPLAAALKTRLEWTYHGEWLLPFDGQAFYDAELEAWTMPGTSVPVMCHLLLLS
ncbi:hypothetical protein HU200_017094 [Digitaria exilis]|uniref:Uncharacterized protein n=1 Tax=Digitaria exilis TaxID=1010633 RepID=A0A835F6G2_9POAL|nr:hypothetical protein HU200_017094 [Digitaria exilis]